MESLVFIAVAMGLIGFAMVSRRLRTSVLTGPLLFTAFGLILSLGVFGRAAFEFETAFLHGLAEITLILVLFILEGTDFPGRETVLTVTVITVCLSILLHGISAAPLSRAYGRSFGPGDQGQVEMRDVSVMPLRGGQPQGVNP